ncbi:MAG: hypothetical protein JKY52_06090 [Flavobacteriales bacterium]|nr:hypothetical protein [Flavobacteriales bacterium]
MDNPIPITEREWASDDYDGLAPTAKEIKGQTHIDLGYPIIEKFPYGYK